MDYTVALLAQDTIVEKSMFVFEYVTDHLLAP